MKLIPEVRLIEAISEDDKGQDAVVNSEIMKMAGMQYKVKKIKESADPKKFLQKLFKGRPRYIHISAHGNGDCLFIGQGKGHVGKHTRTLGLLEGPIDHHLSV